MTKRSKPSAAIMRFAPLSNTWLGNKLSSIILDDGRIETNWKQENEFNRTTFALGADNKKMDLPLKLKSVAKVKR